MTLAATLKSLTTSLVGQYGASVTFTRTSAGTYDPNTSTVAVTGAASTVNAVVLKRSRGQRGDSMGTQAAVQLLIPAESLPTVAIGDRATFEGSAFTVESIEPQYLQEQVVFWQLTLSG